MRAFRPEMSSLADEVWDSLKQGDHLRHGRQKLRAIASLAVLLLLLVLPGRTAPKPAPAKLTFVLANPVAHGARLGAAVMEALEGMDVNVVGDSRLAEDPVSRSMHHFPSLTVRSFGPSANAPRLWRAVALRRRTVLEPSAHPGLTRPYLEILFLLQAIRYDLARSWVESQPRDHVWLADFDRPAYSRPLIWQARRLGRKTATLVHGTPNRNYLPLIADDVLVWGETQVRWFGAASREVRCHVVGRPEIRKSVAPAPPARVRVMHSMEQLTEVERESLARVCTRARAWGLECTLRPHPSLAGADLDHGWEAVAGSLRIEDASDFFESLLPGDIVVGVNSTAIIDALTAGVPAFTLADPGRELPCDLEKLREASIPLAVLTGPSQDSVLELPGSDVSSLAGLLDPASLVVAATGAEAAGLLRRTIESLVN